MSSRTRRWRGSRGAHTTRRSGASVVACGVALVVSLTSLPSFAQDIKAPKVPSTESLPVALSILQAGLNARVQQLNRLGASVESAKSLTPSNRSALAALVSNDLARLDALEASSASDTTLAEVRTDEAIMVLAFHVFALVTPVVKGVIRADAAHAAAEQILGLLPSVQASILASNSSSDRIARAKALLALLSSIAAEINASVVGISPRLLAIGPTSVPGALPELGALSSAIVGAEQQVKLAYASLGQIILLIAGSSVAHASRSHASKVRAVKLA